MDPDTLYWAGVTIGTGGLLYWLDQLDNRDGGVSLFPLIGTERKKLGKKLTSGIVALDLFLVGAGLVSNSVLEKIAENEAAEKAQIGMVETETQEEIPLIYD